MKKKKYIFILISLFIVSGVIFYIKLEFDMHLKTKVQYNFTSSEIKLLSDEMLLDPSKKWKITGASCVTGRGGKLIICIEDIEDVNLFISEYFHGLEDVKITKLYDCYGYPSLINVICVEEGALYSKVMNNKEMQLVYYQINDKNYVEIGESVWENFRLVKKIFFYKESQDYEGGVLG